MNEIEVLVRARYPIIYVLTWEEDRVQDMVIDISRNMNKNIFSWSVTKGLAKAGASLQSKKEIVKGSTDPLAALDEVLVQLEPAIYVFKDFHPYMTDPSIVRKLRELAEHLKNSYKTLIIISPSLKIPTELEKDVTVVDFDLPDFAEMEKLLNNVISDIKDKKEIKIDLTDSVRENLIKALLGLTLKEAENVIARAIILKKKLDVETIKIVLSEKKQIIRKSGLLEYYEHQEVFEGIGGLEILKDWLAKRNLAFSEKAAKFGLPAPKGVLLIGIQGCGKSLCAKTVSALWRQPLLRLDMSRIFSSLIGSSEESMRKAIKTAESIAPAVMWIDEIEKAFAGTQSSSFSDAGTSARVFGGFITWLQEKTKPVFVIATANDISQLPPELFRKGRFDEIFFVDLPSKNERKEIFSIHLKKKQKNPEEFDLDLLAEKSAGFSGSEIEQAIISALYDVFYREKTLKTEDVLKSIQETVPLSKTMSEKIEEMRKWAEGRARLASNKGGN